MKLNEAIIFEGVQEDAGKRKVANNLIDLVHSEVRSSGLSRFKKTQTVLPIDRNYSVRGFVKDFIVNDSVHGIKEFRFIIAIKPPSVRTTGQYFPDLFKMPTVAIYIDFPAELDVDNWFDQNNDWYEIESYISDMISFDRQTRITMFHEFIHMIDDVIGGWLRKASKTPSYFNRPEEISTFTSEIIAEFEEAYFSEIDDLMGRGDFNHFERWLMYLRKNTAFSYVENELGERNKRRLISRLYQFWDQRVKGHLELDPASFRDVDSFYARIDRTRGEKWNET